MELSSGDSEAETDTRKHGFSCRVCWAVTHLIVEVMHISTCMNVYNFFSEYWDDGMIGDLLAHIRDACENDAGADALNDRMTAAQTAGLVDLATGTALPQTFDSRQQQSQQLCIVYQQLDNAVRLVALGPIPLIMTVIAAFGCAAFACLPSSSDKSYWIYTVFVSIALVGQLDGYYTAYDATWAGDDSLCTFFGWNCDAGPACPDAAGCPTGSAYDASACVPPAPPPTDLPAEAPTPSVDSTVLSPAPSPGASTVPPPPQHFLCSSMHCASCRTEEACVQQGGCAWSEGTVNPSASGLGARPSCLQPPVPCLKDWKTLQDNMPRPPGTLVVETSQRHHDASNGDTGRRSLRLGHQLHGGDNAEKGDEMCGGDRCESCLTRTACASHFHECEWRLSPLGAAASCETREQQVAPPEVCGALRCGACVTPVDCNQHHLECEWRGEASAGIDAATCTSRNDTRRLVPSPSQPLPAPARQVGSTGSARSDTDSTDYNLVTAGIAAEQAAVMAQQNCVPADQCMLASADLYLDLVWNTCIARDIDDLLSMLWNTAQNEYGQYLYLFIFTTAMTTSFRLLVVLHSLCCRSCLTRSKCGRSCSRTSIGLETEIEMEMMSTSRTEKYTPPQLGESDL